MDGSGFCHLCSFSNIRLPPTYSLKHAAAQQSFLRDRWCLALRSNNNICKQKAWYTVDCGWTPLKTRVIHLSQNHSRSLHAMPTATEQEAHLWP